MSGVVYFVQTTDMEQSQCKIGMSAMDDDRRLSTYGKETTIVRKLSCNNPRDVEHQLVSLFSEKFSCFKGREYFEGDIEQMIQTFDSAFSLSADIRVLPRIDIQQQCSMFQTDIKQLLQRKPFQMISKREVIQMIRPRVIEYIDIDPQLFARIDYYLLHPRFNENIVCSNVELVRFGVLSPRPARETKKKVSKSAEDTLAQVEHINLFLSRLRIQPEDVIRLRETAERRAKCIDDWVTTSIASKQYLDLLPAETLTVESNRGNVRPTTMKYITINDLFDCIIAKNEDRKHIKMYAMMMRRMITIYHEEVVAALQ